MACRKGGMAEYRSDDTCSDSRWECLDGGPNHLGRHAVYCTLGTDATDCGTPPAPPPLSGTIEVTIETYTTNDAELSRESRTGHGSLTFGSPVFSVTSGCSAKGRVDGAYVCTDDTPPCTVSEGGRCVGRPEVGGGWQLRFASRPGCTDRFAAKVA